MAERLAWGDQKASAGPSKASQLYLDERQGVWGSGQPGVGAVGARVQHARDVIRRDSTLADFNQRTRHDAHHVLEETSSQ